MALIAIKSDRSHDAARLFGFAERQRVAVGAELRMTRELFNDVQWESRASRPRPRPTVSTRLRRRWRLPSDRYFKSPIWWNAVKLLRPEPRLAFSKLHRSVAKPKTSWLFADNNT
jgi:hypothetical protein